MCEKSIHRPQSNAECAPGTRLPGGEERSTGKAMRYRPGPAWVSGPFPRRPAGLRPPGGETLPSRSSEFLCKGILSAAGRWQPEPGSASLDPAPGSEWKAAPAPGGERSGVRLQRRGARLPLPRRAAQPTRISRPALPAASPRPRGPTQGAPRAGGPEPGGRGGRGGPRIARPGRQEGAAAG